MFILVSCNAVLDLQDYDEFLVDQLLTIDENPITNVPADGHNSALIKVTLSRKATKGKRTVVLKTDKGFFHGGSDSLIAEADNNFNISADLYSVQKGDATIHFKIQNVTLEKKKQVTFVQAFPTDISVKVDSFSVFNNYNAEVLITASLKSKNGIPTVGQPVTFKATINKNDFGDFLNNISQAYSDTQGKARIRFNPGKNATEGYATITATTINSDGEPQSGTTRIYIKPK